MQTRLSDFVKIEYLNKTEIMNAVTKLAQGLSEKHPEIEEICLFGSFARNEAVPESDVDILIILKDSDVSFKDRLVRYMPSYFPIGIDIFPYMHQEIEMMVEQGNYFIKSAIIAV